MTNQTTETIPSAFIWRRLQSLMGIWLTFYVIIHLLTNSQAALLFGDDGRGFIHSVNSIQDLPFLPFLEFAILGVPIIIHIIWGVKYIQTAKYDSFTTDGSTPSLTYGRNKAYTWQRITAWMLVILLLGHVIQMRFIEHPNSAKVGDVTTYIYRVNNDPGLATVAERLGVQIYNAQDLQTKKELLGTQRTKGEQPLEIQAQEQQQDLLESLEKWPLKDNQVLVTANNFGTVELLMLRDTFQSPVMLVLYTLLVLTACFHAFNGMWTFMLKWGIIITEKSQKIALRISQVIMVLVALLGLAAVWGTYWINLKQ